MCPQSPFEPSETKISSASMSRPCARKSCSAIVSRRKSQPAPGPYPRNVSRRPISSIAVCTASIAAAGSGSLTSPMPQWMIRSAHAGSASQKAV